jgi:vancomycin resistance protein YoaR
VTVPARSAGPSAGLNGRNPTGNSDGTPVDSRGVTKLPPLPWRALKSWHASTAALGAGVLVLFAVWGVAAALDGGGVARNVSLAGRDVSGMDRVALTAVVDEIAAGYATTPVELRVDGQTITTTAGDLGISVDRDETVAQALRLGQPEAPFPLGPFEWIGSLLADHEAHVIFDIDEGAVLARVPEIAAETEIAAIEPTVTIADGTLALSPGVAGARVDPTAVLEALPVGSALAAGPIVIDVATVPVTPTVADSTIGALIDDAERRSTSGLQLRVPNDPDLVDVPADTIRGWWKPDVAVDDANGTVVLTLDQERILRDLETILEGRGTSSGDASFVVGFGTVVIVPPPGGQVCCDPATAIDVAEALADDPPTPTPVRVSLRTAVPEREIDAAEALGIKEVVGTFTTRHQCCEDRVDNIHRIADLIRGQVILPGETFSVNEFVGPRTTEKGFVVAHVIENGVFEDAVGGGISQFATTMFNAAYFAGLDFEEYQSHSIYISRYPRGREATLSYPHPDLKVENTTPYGILIWPEYTDTTLTVTLYSTKYVTVEQTGQEDRAQQLCTRVITHRRRTYPDGTVKNDEVFAQYRPAEGLNCLGEPTIPTTTTTTTTLPGETTVPVTGPDGSTTLPGATTVPGETTVPTPPAGATTTSAPVPPTSVP